jgi:hypothetical protein
MTADGINPTIGATEGTEMEKKKQITNRVNSTRLSDELWLYCPFKGRIQIQG